MNNYNTVQQTKTEQKLFINQEYSKGHNEMLQDSLRAIHISTEKDVADTAEQFAISKQQAAESAVKDADDARIAAEMARKTADDRERYRQEISLPGSGTLYHKMLEDSLRTIKDVADTAEQLAISEQQAAEHPVKDADDARIAAEMARKTADDRERYRQENPLPGSGTLYHKMLEDSLRAIKDVADATEQFAISKQQAAEHAVKDADDARIAAEMARKTADDREKSRRELGGDASTSTGMKR